MDVLDSQGKTVHYSGSWEPVSFTGNQDYKPGKSFRIYTSNSITLVLKGVLMKRSDAIAIDLVEGYHNFVCDAVLYQGSDNPDGVLALF